MLKENDFHDATLKSIFFEWDAGRCSVELTTATKPLLKIIFTGVTNLVIPKQHPWGASVSINSFSDFNNGLFKLQMQSGDELVIQATAYSVH